MTIGSTRRTPCSTSSASAMLDPRGASATAAPAARFGTPCATTPPPTASAGTAHARAAARATSRIVG
eukprot:3188369-Alexandrium_andersonii.AAC.1